MNAETPATDATKTALENSVNWFLTEALAAATTPVVTKKYLTKDNLLIYLTHCGMAELTVPRLKIQVLRRVEGGVQETGYQMYGDHRLERYENAMIFGTAPESAQPAGNTTVSEQDCKELIELVNSLQTASPAI